MAMTAAQHLALIDSVIQKRLEGCGMESFSEAEARFKGATISQLYEIRSNLKAEDRADTGASFALYSPL